jgi:phosphatidylglycerol:prolipoprotein diacylglycerol transferase
VIPYIAIPARYSWGPFTLHPFGLLVVMACVVGYVVGHWHSRRAGLDVIVFRRLTLWVLVWGFALSYWVSLGLYYPETLPVLLTQQPLRLLNLSASMSSYGGFCGAALGALWYGKRHRLPLRAYGDALTVGWTAGWFFGRLGCTLTHDHPGIPSTFVLAVHFPDGPRHDLGLYEWLFTIGLNILVFALRRMSLPDGALVGLVSVCYAPMRFFLDFLRVGERRYWGLTPGQYLSVALLGFGLWILLTLRSQRAGPDRTVRPPGRVGYLPLHTS